MNLLNSIAKASGYISIGAAALGLLAAPFLFFEGADVQEPHTGVVAGAFAESDTPYMQPTVTPTPTPTPLPIAEPLRIEIPSINVDSSVVNVGVTDDNVMEVPKDYSQVGWFDKSYRPGEQGSYAAIMSGHFDRTDGSPAVFYDLEDLENGSEIIITDKSGLRFFFKVEEKFSHPLQGFPSDLVYGEVSFPSLKLITCDGVWHTGVGSYSDRLVITARLVQIERPI